MNRIIKYLRKNRRWILVLLAVVCIKAILNVGVIVSENLAHHVEIDLIFYLINEFTGGIAVIPLFPLLLWFFRKYPLRQPHILSRLCLYLLLSVVFGFLYTSLMYSMRLPLYWLAGITRLNEIFNDLPFRYLMEYFKQFWTFWLIYIVYWAWQQYEANKARALHEVELREELLKSQVKSLQMQLHPHFFFNTLNTISSVMYYDPAKADKLISRLSEFLRNVIRMSDQPLHSLDREIALLRQFTAVMEERYPDNLSVDYQIAEKCLDWQVPVLLLQPIVENAIQYSIDHQAQTKIEVSTKAAGGKLQVEVKDNGPGIMEGEVTHGTGLSSVVLRLRKLYGDRFDFELKNLAAGGLRVAIALPKSD